MVEPDDVSLVLDFIRSQCESDRVAIEISERGRRALDHFREITPNLREATRKSRDLPPTLKSQADAILGLIHQLQDQLASHNSVKVSRLNETLGTVHGLLEESRPDIRSLLLQLRDANEVQLKTGWSPFFAILDEVEAELESFAKIVTRP